MESSPLALPHLRKYGRMEERGHLVLSHILWNSLQIIEQRRGANRRTLDSWRFEQILVLVFYMIDTKGRKILQL